MVGEVCCLCPVGQWVPLLVIALLPDAVCALHGCRLVCWQSHAPSLGRFLEHLPVPMSLLVVAHFGVARLGLWLVMVVSVVVAYWIACWHCWVWLGMLRRFGVLVVSVVVVGCVGHCCVDCRFQVLVMRMLSLSLSLPCHPAHMP